MAQSQEALSGAGVASLCRRRHSESGLPTPTAYLRGARAPSMFVCRPRPAWAPAKWEP